MMRGQLWFNSLFMLATLLSILFSGFGRPLDYRLEDKPVIAGSADQQPPTRTQGTVAPSTENPTDNLATRSAHTHIEKEVESNVTEPAWLAVSQAVDRELATAWQQVGFTPTGETDPLTVARRLALGLVGSIPSLEEIRGLQDRIATVGADQALREWSEHWIQSRRFADHLAERLARATVSSLPAEPFFIYRRRRFLLWLSDEIHANRPYDQIVRAMIADEGVWTDKPATNFLTGYDVDPVRLTTQTARGFLGLRLDCAQCHDHPFTKWQQEDFTKLAGFYGYTKLDFLGIRDVKPESSLIDPVSKNKVTVTPAVPFQSDLLPSVGSPRERLANWVTAKENRFFARAFVNRAWALLFGRGLVEPIDDLEAPCPLPEVLDLLADDFRQADYDIHRLFLILSNLRTLRLHSALTDGIFHPPAEGEEWEQSSSHSAIALAEASSQPQSDPHASLPSMWQNAQRLSGKNPVVNEVGEEIGTIKEPMAWLDREQLFAAFPVSRLRPDQVAKAIVQSSQLKTIDERSHLLFRLIEFGNTNDFIRDFGDAGTEEMADHGGNISQRLLMMNGKIVRERTEVNPVLANASGRIARLTRSAAIQLETAYLVCLSRLPTDGERDYFMSALETAPTWQRDRMLEDLFWALLNATEFSWNH